MEKSSGLKSSCNFMRERVGSVTRATREFLWVGVSASRGNFQPKESELESTEMRERERESATKKNTPSVWSSGWVNTTKEESQSMIPAGGRMRMKHEEGGIGDAPL